MKIYKHYSIYGFSNSYTVVNEETSAAIIVDPAEVTVDMIEQIEQKSYALDAVLVTHNHIHHCRGLKTLMRIYSPRIYASNARIFSFPCRKVRDREVFEEGGLSIQAIAMPGHSQDSMVFRIESSLFTGDAIHAGILGKTTSAFNARSLYERLMSRLSHLPDDSIIFPGHGPPTTLGTEKKYNIGLDPRHAEKAYRNYDFFV